MSMKSQPKTPFLHCGRINHQPGACRFCDAECHKCGRRGHITTVCRSSKRHRPPRKKTGGKESQHTKWVSAEESATTKTRVTNRVTVNPQVVILLAEFCDEDTRIALTGLQLAAQAKITQLAIVGKGFLTYMNLHSCLHAYDYVHHHIAMLLYSRYLCTVAETIVQVFFDKLL